MIGFALRAVGPREDRRRPARRRDPLQAGRRVIGRDDDRVIRSPGGAAGNAVERRQRDRRPAGHRHLPQRVAAVHEPDPLAIGRDERPARRAGEHRHRLEGVERADEELRAAVAHIDDAGAVRRDRQVTVVAVDGQRGGTRRRDHADARHEAARSAGRVANHTRGAATAATTSAPAVSAATRRHSGLRGSGAADTVPAGGARLAPFSSTNSAVEMSATRRRRSLVRQL